MYAEETEKQKEDHERYNAKKKVKRRASKAIKDQSNLGMLVGVEGERSY